MRDRCMKGQFFVPVRAKQNIYAQLTYINYRFSTNLYPPSTVSLMTIWSWCMVHSSTCFHVIWKLIERQFSITFVIVSAVWHILWPTIYTDPRTWTKEVKSCLILAPLREGWYGDEIPLILRVGSWYTKPELSIALPSAWRKSVL